MKKISVLGTTLFALLIYTCGYPQVSLRSWEEYRAMRVHPPYILELQSDEGALLYFGAEHTSDLAHPQFAQIENYWEAFNPTLVFSEGGRIRPQEQSRDIAIQKYGEQGLLRWLAAKDSVPIRSIEPDQNEEVAALLSTYTPEQLKFYYLTREVVSYQRNQPDKPLEDYLVDYLERYNKVPSLSGPPRTFTELDSLYDLWFNKDSDWRAFPSRWVAPSILEVFTNHIARDVVKIRDTHHVKTLVQAVNQGERVFSVIGFGHVVVQEPALRKALQ